MGSSTVIAGCRWVKPGITKTSLASLKFLASLIAVAGEGIGSSTVIAGCRWVKPGITTSTSASALATVALMRSAREARTSWRAPYSHSLVSVAHCTHNLNGLDSKHPLMLRSQTLLNAWSSSSER